MVSQSSHLLPEVVAHEIATEEVFRGDFLSKFMNHVFV